MNTPLHGAWLKWAWASRHAKGLEADINRTLERQRQPPFKPTHDYDPKLHGFIVSVASIRPTPPRWGLNLGDIVHNYRCVLDYVAWFLVARGQTPNLTEKQAKNVYFPIALSGEQFKASIPQMLPGVRRADLAIVRRYQPYKAGTRNIDRHCLTTLAKLSNMDKHRTLQPLWLRTHEAQFAITRTVDFEVRRIVLPKFPRPMEVGTELLRIYGVRTGPDPDIEVQGEIAPDVALDERIWVKNFCDTTMKFVGRLLAEFEPPSDEPLVQLR